MGWSSGSGLMADIIEAVEEYAHPDSDKVTMFAAMIEAFEGYDCDNLCECLGHSPNFDLAFERLNPEYAEDMRRMAEEEEEAMREEQNWLEHREETWGGNYE